MIEFIRTLIVIAAISGMLCGCGPANVNPPQPEDASKRTVAVGNDTQEAIQMLISSGAEKVQYVGILPIKGQFHWYKLRDGTCLCVWSAQSGEPAREVVQSLTLGEVGKGYGGKINWLEQKHREVAVLELP